jgi:hypothetical protein
MPTTRISKHQTIKHIREMLMEEHGTEYFVAVDYWNRYDLDTLMGHKFFPQSLNQARTKWAGYKVNGKTGKRTQVKAGDLEVLITQCRFNVRCRVGRWQDSGAAGHGARARRNPGWANMTDDQRVANAGNFRNERYNILARHIRDERQRIGEGIDAAHAAHAGNHEALMAFFQSERRRIGVAEPEEAPPIYAEEDPLAPPAYE